MLGDDALRTIARELADTVRRNATIDWTVKESARANLRRLVRRILARHGYPPDKQEQATLTVLEQAELLGLEVAAEPVLLPFRRLGEAEAEPFVNCIPLYSLAAAAGSFGETQAPEAEAWVVPSGQVRPAPDLFVAQVVGESMNRRIPSGAFCVFRAPVEGSRTGRVLLVQHREISDPDTGGSYTVKLYERVSPDAVLLKPETDADGYRPIEVKASPRTTCASSRNSSTCSAWFPREQARPGSEAGEQAGLTRHYEADGRAAPPHPAARNPREANRLLLVELNRAVVAGEIDYKPFG